MLSITPRLKGSWLPTWLAFGLALAITAPLTVYWWQLMASGSVAFDWRIFVQAGERFWAGSPNLYEVSELYSFRHSPVMAMLMPLVAWIGVIGVRAMTVASALAMPTWPMRAIALVSWPFAMDLQHGALITVIVLAAAWALMGSRIAALAFIILALLSPRPLMIPIAGYLLWHQPWLRLPALVLFVVHGLAVVATGYGDDWVSMLVTSGSDMLVSPFNLSPSRFMGLLWLAVAVPLWAFLTWRGRLGLAALAANPYVLPHYLLLLLLEIRPQRGHRAAPAEIEA